VIQKIYSIYDVKVGLYMQPFPAHTHGMALRMFSDHVNDPNTITHKHPADFALFHLADFDESEGRYQNRDKPEHLAQATDFLEVTKAPPTQLDITDAINRAKKGNAR